MIISRAFKIIVCDTWALAIFDETTFAAFKSYFPERKDVADFVTLINSWWTVVNARTHFASNPLVNAPVQGDGKADFLFFLPIG